jgi:hypothetical protein
MATSIKRLLVPRVSGSVFLLGLLVGCGGGGLIAILQIVTPLAGVWNQEGANGSITFGDAEAKDKLYSGRVSVNARVEPLPGVCGSNESLSGTIDSGRLKLFPPASTNPCIEGSFTNLRRLEVSVSGQSGKVVFLNDRVAVNLQEGVWASENDKTRLKFNANEASKSVNNNETQKVSGCDISDPLAKVGFKGNLFGFNTGTGAKPSIPELLKSNDNSKLFTSVEYVDGDTLTLRNAANEGITLTREDESASCS